MRSHLIMYFTAKMQFGAGHIGLKLQPEEVDAAVWLDQAEIEYVVSKEPSKRN